MSMYTTSNVQPSPVPVRAHLTSIEVVGDIEKNNSTGIPDHFAVVYVDEREITKSEKKSWVPSLRWEWPEDHQFQFHPSSTFKIAIYQERKTRGKDLIGQHIAKVINLLENDGTIALEDKAGATVASKVKINLSLIPETDNTFESFMESVATDISRLDGAVQVPPVILALGKALQLTKNIMDIVANVDPTSILKASCHIMSAAYTAIKQIELQDDTVQDLAESLREMLGIAKEYPNLLLIKGTTNVIEEIGRTSLNVASLIHEYSRPTFIRRALSSQASDKMKARIAKCQKSCDDLKQKFNTRVNMDTNFQGAKTQGIVTEIKGAINTNNANIQSTLNTIKDDQLAKEIRQWLAAPDSSKNYNEAREKHQKDTFSWFIEGDQFRELQDTSFLWIKGTAGCGKTILCSSVIDKIIQLRKQDAFITYAYFFFDGRDSQNDLQLHNKLIRSLILQLSIQCDSIPDVLVQLYGLGHHQPSTAALEDALRHIIDGLHLTYLVIDSLDECTERDKTLWWIKQMVSSKVGNLRIVVASRPERDIIDVLQQLEPRCVDLSEEVNRDIALYLEQQLLLVKKWDAETRRTVKLRLIERAQGMFRWIALQVMELKKCSNKHSVMKQLDSLPSGLYETYDRILLKIGEHSDRTDTKTFLRWLCFSIRPMTLVELAETITVHFDMNYGPLYAPEHRYWDERDVLEKCSGLITESEGVIKLAHFSFKEYLLSEHSCMGATSSFHLASEELSHSLISQTCLAYLLQFDAPGLVDENLAVSSPLAPYAAEHWIFHAKSGGIDKSESSWTLALAKRLFINHGVTFTNWLHICDFDFLIGTPERYIRHPNPERTSIGSPLYYASLTGLHQITLHLLEGGNVNAVGGRYGNALQAASYKGHDVIVKLLLERGADVNAHGGKFETALQAASFVGNEAIVGLLLENGANLNAPERSYNNLFIAPAPSGHEAIAQLLLKKGANVGAQAGGYRTARRAASFDGSKASEKLLLENGVDVNARGSMYDYALHAASESGQHKAVKLLLEEGANPNANGQTGSYGNAIQAASNWGHEAIVKLLLEHGADVNAQDNIYGTPLQGASSNGHIGVVRLLLENGANVYSGSKVYGNALKAASSNGHDEIAKLLVEYGADPTILL